METAAGTGMIAPDKEIREERSGYVVKRSQVREFADS
jgi:hypothetical protein